jgi:AraC-like DNA-binding protein
MDAGLNVSRNPVVAFARVGGARFAERMGSGVHRQHAFALLVGLDASVRVALGDRVLAGPVLAVAPDVAHAAASDGPAVALLFDPEVTGARGDAGSGSGAGSGAGSCVVGAQAGRRIRDAVLGHRASIGSPDVLTGLLAELRPRPVKQPRDVRVDRVLDRLGPGADDTSRLTIVDAARLAGISPAHLRDLFQAAIGISPRRYRLWSRLVRALRYPAGNATKSAAMAGFADLAHFSRTCRAMLGYAPARVGAIASRPLKNPRPGIDGDPRSG